MILNLIQVLIIFLFIFPLASEESGKRYALVIGINEYKDKQIPDLKKAKNDATSIIKLLYNDGSYDKIVSLVQDGGRAQMNETTLDRPNLYGIETSLTKLLDVMNPDDFLLIYFSGHGLTDYNEKAYILPEDTDPNAPFQTGIAVENMVYKILKKNLKKVIFIIDACRNPENGKGEEGRDYLKNVSFSQVEMVSVFYSTKVGYYSYEDEESSYGVFTKFIIYGLEGRADADYNGQVTFSELSEFVISSLKQWSSKNQKLQKPFVKIFGEKSDNITLTYAYNPEVSLADAPLFNPYNPTYAFRSFVLPGWGQYTRGQEKKGVWMMSIYTFALLHAGFRYYEYKNALRDYENAPGVPPISRPFETTALNYLLINPSRENLDQKRELLEYSLGAVFILWSANILDFYIWGPERKKDRSQGFLLDLSTRSTGQLGRESFGTAGYEFSF
jgi:hypothetical protein